MPTARRQAHPSLTSSGKRCLCISTALLSTVSQCSRSGAGGVHCA
jgi:hypothetical protein